MQCTGSTVWLGCFWPPCTNCCLGQVQFLICIKNITSLSLQAAKEKDYWKEMSDASLERIRTTYTWCVRLPLLPQEDIKSATASA